MLLHLQDIHKCPTDIFQHVNRMTLKLSVVATTILDSVPIRPMLNSN